MAGLLADAKEITFAFSGVINQSRLAVTHAGRLGTGTASCLYTAVVQDHMLRKYLARTASSLGPLAPAGRREIPERTLSVRNPRLSFLGSRAGARVVKLESSARPDGARLGPPAFFDLLNAGKDSVALDCASERGSDTIRRLIELADVVVQSARPRALRELGIDVVAVVAVRPGRTWRRGKARSALSKRSL